MNKVKDELDGVKKSNKNQIKLKTTKFKYLIETKVLYSLC